MTDSRSSQTPAPETVETVLALAARALGRRAALRSWTELAKKSTFVSVVRLGLEMPDGAAASVIAKFALPDAPAVLRAAVREEVLVYRFLAAEVADFPYAPALLAHDTDAMILRDLGEDRYAFADADTAARAMAETLATLHLTTCGREADYRRCRTLWGYPPPAADPRAGSEAMSLQVFRAAAAMLSQWCAVMVPSLQPGLLDQLRLAEAAVRDAGRFRALVHDDWVERRQSVAIDGRFHLIDFEHAKYFHCLSDLTKIMIGTLSNETLTGRLFHQRYRHSEHLFAFYRAAWAGKGGPALPDAEWREHMVALLLFQAASVIGRIIGTAQMRFETSPTDCIRSVLDRLSEQVRGIAPGHPLTALAAELSGRILPMAAGGDGVPPSGNSSPADCAT